MQWSWKVLEEHIAPELKNLTKFTVPALDDMPNYFGPLMLNQVFQAKLPEKDRRLVRSFVARTEYAIQCYRAGADNLKDYISKLPKNDHTRSYRVAVMNFESCILSAHMAINCETRILEIYDVEGSDAAKKDPDCNTLRKLSNRIKHFDEDIIENGAEATYTIAPVWLTNDSIKSATAELSFVKLHEILVCAQNDCKWFAEDFFKAIIERMKSKKRLDAEKPVTTS